MVDSSVWSMQCLVLTLWVRGDVVCRGCFFSRIGLVLDLSYQVHTQIRAKGGYGVRGVEL